MKTNIKSITVVLVMLIMAMGLLGADVIETDVISLSMRLYEGIDEKASSEAVVSTSSYMESAYIGKTMSDADLDEERQKMIDSYKVSDVKLVVNTNWTFISSYPPRLLRVFQKNGSHINIRLTRKEAKDTFKIELFNGKTPKGKLLLETEVVLPQKNKVIYGFKDTDNHVYMLSFHRQVDGKGMQGKLTKEEARALSRSQHRAELVKHVRPDYPEMALKLHVEGSVQLSVQIDDKGDVISAKVKHGHPLLRKAALDAVRQWKYKPPKDGKPSPPFAAMVFFKLPGKQGSSKKNIDNGAIIGTVTDEEGNMMAGVQVKLMGVGKTKTTQTDHNGFYGFMAIYPGNHTLKFTHDGYMTVMLKHLQPAGKTIKVNAYMKKRK